MISRTTIRNVRHIKNPFAKLHTHTHTHTDISALWHSAANFAFCVCVCPDINNPAYGVSLIMTFRFNILPTVTYSFAFYLNNLTYFKPATRTGSRTSQNVTRMRSESSLMKSLWPVVKRFELWAQTKLWSITPCI